MGLRGSKLTTPRISLGEENPQIVEDPTPLEKPSKSTGLRGSKLTTNRIELGDENHKASNLDDRSKVDKEDEPSIILPNLAAKSNISRASGTLRISFDQSQLSLANKMTNKMVTSTPIQKNLNIGPRASMQSQKIAINSSVRYVLFIYYSLAHTL